MRNRKKVQKTSAKSRRGQMSMKAIKERENGFQLKKLEKKEGLTTRKT